MIPGTFQKKRLKTAPGTSAPAVEAFALSSARERWPDFLGFEHAVLPLPADYDRSNGDFLVSRDVPSGRRLRDGRICPPDAAALFLQAASACAWLAGAGLWLDEEDLEDAVWDREGGAARLWLVRTPSGVRRGGPGPPVCALLAALLERVRSPSRRRSDGGARGLRDLLLAADAPFRRPDFWVACAFRFFPELSAAEAWPIRLRTIGLGGVQRRSASVRARLEKARALLAGRSARLFEPAGSSLAPGGALGLESVPATSAAASRALRERYCAEASDRRAVWIAAAPETWDTFSRRAFDSAAAALDGHIEVLHVPATCPSPRLPDEWRREVFVPCGTLTASMRFYEALSAHAVEDGRDARAFAQTLLASSGWGSYVADPTGQAALPAIPIESSDAAAAERAGTASERDLLACIAAAPRPVAESELRAVAPSARSAALLRSLEASGDVAREPGRRWAATGAGRRRAGLSASARRDLCRRWAAAAPDPARRIEWLLEAGEEDEALARAASWIGDGPTEAERWFEISARLAARGGELPPWLEMLEAEREVAGGRSAEAEARLQRLRDRSGASADELRRASLRLAEVAARRGRAAAAGRDAAAWLRAHPEAPVGERARALCLEAAALAREGGFERALECVERAESAAAPLSLSERLETGLVRADVYSAAGRFREEAETYSFWRGVVLPAGDDALTVRLLAREALGLADRRQFDAAIGRLEEALGASRDDPAEAARVRIDLAATLYHAGRPARAAPLLEEAIRDAAVAGREDLVHVARTNRVELAIDGGQWDTAAAEVDRSVADAQERRDDRRLLVALHQRSRLWLRQGQLDRAARDNESARELAARISDRVEVGELWLEWGDLSVHAGQFDRARDAYELAASHPPDRCDSDVRARQRLAELAWRTAGSAPAEALEELGRLFESDELAAAERFVRWNALLGPHALPEPLARRARATLSARGAGALAATLPGAVDAAPGASEGLRPIRAALARALTGQASPGDLACAGLTRIAVSDAAGREIAAAGEAVGPEAPYACRSLDSGACAYELRIWPPPDRARESELAWMVETLLYRPRAAAAPCDFEEGWRRLGIVTGDPSMEEPYRRLVRFAAQPVTVLVHGESGTGKEAVARAVHALSPRAAGPFVAVNVPAIPAALLESELFGHVKGAFTGADRDRAGLLEAAAGGTIFFDEIADLAPPLQSKLLRALQDREIRRVGENRTRRIDVRVVSATSRDLAREVEAGRFREDLFYRLNVALVALPALRARAGDARLLANHFLRHYAREYGRGELRFDPDALEALASYAWPGNVRELQNAVAQGAALADEDGRLRREHLPTPVGRERTAAAPAQNYRARLDAHRRGLITDALERSGGNRTHAARELGLSRQALAYLIRELRVAPRPGHRDM